MLKRDKIGDFEAVYVATKLFIDENCDVFIYSGYNFWIFSLTSAYYISYNEKSL